MATRQEQIDSVIQDVVDRLRAALGPRLIYQFGSSARGGAGASSDLDLLVIVEDSPHSYFKRCAIASRALQGVAVPVDVVVYTRAEFEARAIRPLTFEHAVRETGRVVYAA